jgi:ankyrin repeat protein
MADKTIKSAMTAFTRAVERDRTEDALQILARVPTLVQLGRPRSPLWLAARHGRSDLVRTLLNSDADPQRVGWDGCSCSLPEKPIHVATRNNHDAVVELLRPHHDPLDIFDSCALGERDRVLDFLRDDPGQANAVRVDDPDGRFPLTPLHWSTFFCRREIIDDLLDAGANVRPESDPSRQTLMPRLSLALCRGYTDIADTLMKAGDHPIDDPETCISFAQAAYGGQQASIDLLLRNDLDINARRVDEEHAAFVHVRHPRYESWLLLLDNGVELNAQRRNGKSMFHIAAARGLKSFVSTLLERGADHTIRDEEGLTARDYARGRKNQKMYEYLIESGISEVAAR